MEIGENSLLVGGKLRTRRIERPRSAESLEHSQKAYEGHVMLLAAALQDKKLARYLKEEGIVTRTSAFEAA